MSAKIKSRSERQDRMKEDSRYPIIIYPAEEGGYVAEVPALIGCLAQGETQAACLKEIKKVQTLWLESAKRNNKKFPAPKRSSPSCGNWLRDPAKSPCAFLWLTLWLQTFWVQRKSCRQFRDVALYFTSDLFRFRGVNHFRNQPADLTHLGFLHATRRNGRCTDAQP